MLPLLLLLVGTAIIGSSMVLSNGNIAVAIALTGVLISLAITMYRLDWGFYLFLGAVLLFDQYGIPGFQPVTLSVYYFSNLNLFYLPGASAAVLTPMELHFLLLLLVWLVVLAMRKGNVLVSVPVPYAMTLFFLWFLFSMVYGRAKGGDTVIAFWETRGILYLGIMYLFVPQVIRSVDQVQNLLWVVMITLCVKSWQGVFRFAGNGFVFAGIDTFTNHEDPVFLVTLFLLQFGLILFGGKGGQRRALAWMAFPNLVGFFVANRRAAIASFGAAGIGFLFLLQPDVRRRLLRPLAVIGLVFAVYLAVFWNDEGVVGTLAQQVKSTVIDDPKAISYRNYLSNYARKIQDYNLAMTYRRAFVMGVGFGMPYDVHIIMWDPLRHGLTLYIPHNQVVWLAVKMGAFGYFTFWFFLDCFIFYGAVQFARLKSPYLQAVLAICILAIINQIVVSYVDMQLTYYRNMVYLGTLMGLVPAIAEANRRINGATEG
jgi:hypothetical protein